MYAITRFLNKKEGPKRPFFPVFFRDSFLVLSLISGFAREVVKYEDVN